MTHTAQTPKAVRLRGSTARKAKVALAAMVVAAGLVMPSLVAGLVAPPAHAQTTFLVTNTNDSGAGSLRQAILDANTTAGADTINFAIPGALRDPSTGVATIKPQSDLPAITEQVTINGYSQPGSSQNTLAKGTNAKPLIQLEGSAMGQGGYGLVTKAPDVVVKGLVINRFFEGIKVDAVRVRIEGDFLGPYPSGTKAPANSQTGVVVFGGGATVGGPDPAARNLISGNDGGGIHFYGGGSAAYGNLIGTSKDGQSPLGNGFDGVYIYSQDHNEVGKAKPGYANTIAFNEKDGVNVFYSVGNSVLSNSIFSNGGLGIDLLGPGETFDTDVLTPNDPLDADAGKDDLQNHPALSSASKPSSYKTVVKGKLNSTPNTTFKVQFFSDPSGEKEGKCLLGAQTVTTDGAGNASLTFPTTRKVSLGQNVTATATNPATGDTSEFSAPKKVVAS